VTLPATGVGTPTATVTVWLVCGAEPLFLQDYIAVGRTVPERVSAIVSGIADGCVLAGCALLGGETAEHPGLMDPDHYDISATGVGIVEADDVLGPERVRPGDVLIAMASSGLHSNGYSLARKVLLEIDRMSLAGHVEEFGRTLGEELSPRGGSVGHDVIDRLKKVAKYVRVGRRTSRSQDNGRRVAEPRGGANRMWFLQLLRANLSVCTPLVCNRFEEIDHPISSRDVRSKILQLLGCIDRGR
jgi:hypothetical protein